MYPRTLHVLHLSQLIIPQFVPTHHSAGSWQHQKTLVWKIKYVPIQTFTATACPEHLAGNIYNETCRNECSIVQYMNDCQPLAASLSSDVEQCTFIKGSLSAGFCSTSCCIAQHLSLPFMKPYIFTTFTFKSVAHSIAFDSRLQLATDD